MRTPRLLVLSLLAGALSLPASASAAPCDQHAYGLPTGPVQAGLNEGSLGTAHRVCGRSEVGLDFGAMLLVDLPNFYGRLGAGLRLDGSWAWGPRGELFGSFEVFRFDNLITPLSSTSIGIGHTNIGAAFRFFDSDRVSIGVNGKVVLPTAVPLYKNVWPLGIDAGVTAQFEAHETVHFHVQASGLTSFGLGKGPSQPRGGVAVTAGTELRPAPGFALVVDLFSSFGYTAPLDVFAAALAIRMSDLKRFGFEIGATVPVVGRERALLRLDLKATIRVGPIVPGQPREKKAP